MYSALYVESQDNSGWKGPQEVSSASSPSWNIWLAPTETFTTPALCCQGNASLLNPDSRTS